MIFLFPRKYRRAFCAACCISALSAAALAGATRQDQSLNRIQDATKKSSEQGPPVRIPRQQAQTSAALDGIVRDAGVPGATRPVPAAVLTLRNVESGQIFKLTTENLETHPLPSWELLEMQWFLQRVVAMSGAAGWPRSDFQDDDDTDCGSMLEEEIDNYDLRHESVLNCVRDTRI